MKITFAVLFFLNEIIFAQELMGPRRTISQIAEKTDQSKYRNYSAYYDSCRKLDSNKKEIKIQAVSPVSMFGTPQMVQSDQKGHSAFDLINAAYKYTSSELKKNLENTKKSLACVDEIFLKNMVDVSKNCIDTANELINTSVAAPLARYELAMALPSSKIINGMQHLSLNTELNIPLNTFKVEKWNALDQREQNIMNEKWSDFLKDVDAEAKEKIKNHNTGFALTSVSEDFKKDLIQQKRKQARLNYHLNMTRYPLIQFIKTNNPQKDDFKKAYQQVIENIQKEIENIKEKQNKLVLNPKKEISSDDLFILNYQTTEDLLANNPEFCSIAQSQMEYQDKKGMYVGAATLTAFVGLSLLKVPPVGIFTAGSAASGLGYYQANTEYKKALQAHLASPIYEDQIFKKTKVDQLQESVVLNGPVSIALGMYPIAGSMKNILGQSEKIAAAQFSKYFVKNSDKELMAVAKSSFTTKAERETLLQKMNAMEAEVMKPIEKSLSVNLNSSGRGIGKKVIYNNSDGELIEAQVLKHVHDVDGTSLIVLREVEQGGRRRLIQLKIPAKDTLPAEL